MEKENKKSSTVVIGYLYQETGGKYSLTKDLYRAQNKHYIPIYFGETSNLIDLIQKFEEECRISENLIEDNKVNLSEQKAKTINIKDYKTKEQKATEEKFYSLSDHLFPGKTEEPDNSA